ncbi:hypothetical protein Tco_1519980, partial [Tanacetum coccineum]
MSTPKFTETHNLVAFLEKPKESSGFEEIIDFLNASYVQYALAVNPTIYTTYCLPTASIFVELERMGYEHLTQKLTFYKAYFSSQWKFLIHTILQCLSAKTTVRNEFSSTLASAIICLATNQTFNFSKYIFDNMVKHLEGVVKFLMMIQASEDTGEDSAAPSDSHSTPIISQPSSSKPQKKNLQEKVIDLEKAKTAQAKEIVSLNKRVKQLEKRRKLRT